MAVVQKAGCSARAVTSGAEVDLLSIGTAAASASGVSISGARSWALAVTTDQSVVVRIYKGSGPNTGLVILTAQTATITSSTPLLLEFDGEANERMRVTAQASSTTAAVNCDLRAVTGAA